MNKFGMWALVLTCASVSVALAETPTLVKTAGLQRSTASAALPPMYYEVGGPANVQQVGFHHLGRGGGAGCGCDSGSCGSGGSCCDHVPSCYDSIWDGYCNTRGHHRLHFGGGLLSRHCGARCAPACETACEPACDTGCSTGCAAPSAGCGCGSGWGFQGCHGCGRHCYRPHCGPKRCWANGWCGEMIDGYSTGHPACGTAPQAMPVDAAPMAPADNTPTPAAPLPMPEKAARRVWNLTPARGNTFGG